MMNHEKLIELVQEQQIINDELHKQVQVLNDLLVHAHNKKLHVGIDLTRNEPRPAIGQHPAEPAITRVAINYILTDTKELLGDL